MLTTEEVDALVPGDWVRFDDANTLLYTGLKPGQATQVVGVRPNPYSQSLKAQIWCKFPDGQDRWTTGDHLYLASEPLKAVSTSSSEAPDPPSTSLLADILSTL